MEPDLLARDVTIRFAKICLGMQRSQEAAAHRASDFRAAAG
jgi:hypothetical protein